MGSVWDYPLAPTAEPESRVVRVELAGVVVAESTRAIRLVERGLPPSFYLPAEDVRADLLVPAEERSLCPVKGTATYWTIRIGASESLRAAWSYADPIPACEVVRGRFAFYAGAPHRCMLGGVEARSTGHPFYAGWIMPDTEGPFVGDVDLPEEYQRRLARPVLARGESRGFCEIAADSLRIGPRYMTK